MEGKKPSIEKRPSGETGHGEPVDTGTRTNAKGAEARITNHGAVGVSLRVPDQDGDMDDIVLGFSTLNDYIQDKFYFGGMVGVVGNWIAGGR